MGIQPSPTKGAAPNFLPICCQASEWVKMPLGTEVGLGHSDVVLDGDPAPTTEHITATFRPMSIWPNGWMDQDATWYRGRSRSRPHCVRWGHSSLPERGTAAPSFRPMFIVAKQSPILWPPYVIGGPLYFCPVISIFLSFFFLLFFPRLISAATDRMSAILLHMAWP